MKIKRAIGVGALTASLKKSCPCLLANSLESQIKRLKTSGYPNEMLSDIERSLIRKAKKIEEEEEFLSTVAVPQIHGFTNRLTKAGRTHNVRVVGTYKNKLGRLPMLMEDMRRGFENVQDICGNHGS